MTDLESYLRQILLELYQFSGHFIFMSGFKVSRVSCWRMFVEDVSQSSEWFQKLFETTPVEILEHFVAFEIAGTRLEIVVADAKNPVSIGGSVAYWHVDDLGGKPYRGPLEIPETQTKIMQIINPFGNIIGFEADL